MKVSSSSAILLSTLTISHGYVLDSSCSAYSDLVKTAMQNAFDLAQAGSDALSAISKSGSGATYTAQKDLTSYLFAEALTNGEVDTSDAKWTKLTSTFTSVLKYNTNNGQPQTTPSNYRSLTSSGLIVYCDYSRFTEGQNCDGVKKSDSVCDNSIGVSTLMGDIYKKCKSTSALSTSSIEAWTFEYASNGVNRASQIQLCPSFLKNQAKAKVQTVKDQGKKPSLARGWKKFNQWLDDPFKTPIDVAYTMDATLLHEMTHAIPNAATVDLAGGGNSDSYGWKNCNKMSSSGGTENADSYSLFGLAARMISPTSSGQAQRPMSDGSLQILATTTATKRMVTAILDIVNRPTTFSTMIRSAESSPRHKINLNQRDPKNSKSNKSKGSGNSNTKATADSDPKTTAEAKTTAQANTKATTQAESKTSAIIESKTTTAADSKTSTTADSKTSTKPSSTATQQSTSKVTSTSVHSTPTSSRSSIDSQTISVSSHKTESASSSHGSPNSHSTSKSSSNSVSRSASSSSLHTTSSSSLSSRSSSCSAHLSIFTPSGAKTASTSTITACSALITSSSSSSSAANTTVTAAPVGDAFASYDSSVKSWYDVQQSILSEAMDDDDDAYITWSSNEVYVSGSDSPAGATTSVVAVTTSVSASAGAATSSGRATEGSARTSTSSKPTSSAAR